MAQLAEKLVEIISWVFARQEFRMVSPKLHRRFRMQEKQQKTVVNMEYFELFQFGNFLYLSN